MGCNDLKLAQSAPATDPRPMPEPLIVVTGATGLIGNAIVQALVRRNCDAGSSSNPGFNFNSAAKASRNSAANAHSNSAPNLGSSKPKVRALVRDIARARNSLPPEAELVRGDVTTPETLDDALRGADLVFHAAGMPEQWQ